MSFFSPLLILTLLAVARTGAAPLTPDVVVAADGTGDFKTIQAAVESIPRENRERRILLVRDGTYLEKVRVDAPFVTLRGQSRAGVRIEFAQASNAFNAKPDPIGRAVVNLGPTAHDFVLENLTVENTNAELGPHAFAVFGLADRTVITDCDLLSHGADTLSLWRGRAENDATVAATMPASGATVWREGGRYYHARLKVTGAVDFICPRGWCYMTDCTIIQLNPGATAAIWHDGSNNPDKKFVLRGCRFDGPPDWYLARRHHDAQFFLLDCTFSRAMRDRAPYRVIYPLNGGPPTAADIKRNQDYDRTNLHGERAYYFNSHREGGDYAWHRDNLASAPGSPSPEKITARWTFGGSWDPENTAGPTVLQVTGTADDLEVTFSEIVTVKGHPELVLADGRVARFKTGSGTASLHFTPPAGALVTAKAVNLNGGAIIATEAAATLRFAALDLR